MKNKLRRVFALVLTSVMLMSLCACAQTNKPGTTVPRPEGGKYYWEMLDSVKDTSELPDWTGETLEIKVWIAGGTDKGNDYTPLKEFARKKVKALVCMGLDNEKLVREFTDIVPTVVSTSSLDEAMRAAVAAAERGDVVLLSPACASFDLFKNYENRGQLFKEWVKSEI